MSAGGDATRQSELLTLVCARRRKGPSKEEGSESRSAEPVGAGSVRSDSKPRYSWRTRLYGSVGDAAMAGWGKATCRGPDGGRKRPERTKEAPAARTDPSGVCAYGTGARGRSTLARTARADRFNEFRAADERNAWLLGRISVRKGERGWERGPTLNTNPRVIEEAER